MRPPKFVRIETGQIHDWIDLDARVLLTKVTLTSAGGLGR